MTATRLLTIGPLAFLALFFAYPLLSILARSFSGDAFGLQPFAAILGDGYYVGRIWFTAWQAAVSTGLTLLLGLPAAYLFAKHDFPGKTVLTALTTLPFIMPTIVVAMGFVALLGPQGLVNDALRSAFGEDAPQVSITNTLTIIFMAHAFYNYAIVVRIVSAFWANLTPRFGESAAMLGAGRVHTFFHVTLPLLMPAIWSSAVLVFVFSFTSFGVVLVLGGSQFVTLEVSIYELTVKLFRLEVAGALAEFIVRATVFLQDALQVQLDLFELLDFKLDGILNLQCNLFSCRSDEHLCLPIFTRDQSPKRQQNHPGQVEDNANRPGWHSM